MLLDQRHHDRGTSFVIAARQGPQAAKSPPLGPAKPAQPRPSFPRPAGSPHSCGATKTSAPALHPHPATARPGLRSCRSRKAPHSSNRRAMKRAAALDLRDLSARPAQLGQRTPESGIPNPNIAARHPSKLACRRQSGLRVQVNSGLMVRALFRRPRSISDNVRSSMPSSSGASTRHPTVSAAVSKALFNSRARSI